MPFKSLKSEIFHDERQRERDCLNNLKEMFLLINFNICLLCGKAYDDDNVAENTR